MSAIKIISTSIQSLAAAVNEQIKDGAAKKIELFTVTENGKTAFVVVTEISGLDRQSSGSIHRLELLSGSAKNLDKNLSVFTEANPLSKIIGLQSCVVEQEIADEKKTKTKASSTNFYALVAILQP